jgi:hypothetical protein
LSKQKAGSRPGLVGGSLIRSLGEWSQVLSLKRAGGKIFSEERILGSSEFVKHAIVDAEEKEKLTLRLRLKIADPASLAGGICEAEGVAESELCSGNRKRNVLNPGRYFVSSQLKGWATAEPMLHDFLV